MSIGFSISSGGSRAYFELFVSIARGSFLFLTAETQEHNDMRIKVIERGLHRIINFKKTPGE
jgi:hypothetical protein